MFPGSLSNILITVMKITYSERFFKSATSPPSHENVCDNYSINTNFFKKLKQINLAKIYFKVVLKGCSLKSPTTQNPHANFSKTTTNENHEIP